MFQNLYANNPNAYNVINARMNSEALNLNGGNIRGLSRTPGFTTSAVEVAQNSKIRAQNNTLQEPTEMEEKEPLLGGPNIGMEENIATDMEETSEAVEGVEGIGFPEIVVGQMIGDAAASGVIAHYNEQVTQSEQALVGLHSSVERNLQEQKIAVQQSNAQHVSDSSKIGGIVPVIGSTVGAVVGAATTQDVPEGGSLSSQDEIQQL